MGVCRGVSQSSAAEKYMPLDRLLLATDLLEGNPESVRRPGEGQAGPGKEIQGSRGW